MNQASGVRAALQHADFRRFAFGRFFATLAWQMLGVAVGWQVYSITRDPLDLGLLGDRHTLHARTLGERHRDVAWVRLAVGGQERRAHHVVHIEPRTEHARAAPLRT